MRDVLVYQLFLHQYSNRRLVENFVIDDETGVTLNGDVNNHKVRMYALANQPPDFLYNVNVSPQKLTVWVGLCGNGDLLNVEVIPLMTV